MRHTPLLSVLYGNFSTTDSPTAWVEKRVPIGPLWGPTSPMTQSDAVVAISDQGLCVRLRVPPVSHHTPCQLASPHATSEQSVPGLRPLLGPIRDKEGCDLPRQAPGWTAQGQPHSRTSAHPPPTQAGPRAGHPHGLSTDCPLCLEWFMQSLQLLPGVDVMIPSSGN